VSHRPAGAILLVASVLVACASVPVPEGSSPFDLVSTENPQDLPQNLEVHEGRPGASGGTILEPVSAHLEPGIAYRFDLGHCGLLSPVDLDGSFWDPLDGTTSSGEPLDLAADPEMINAASGVVVVIGDEARFRTAGGSVVRFARHEGEKEFPGCD
jgi:hypothetical protein